MATGRDFLGWKTTGQNIRWLILQTENGNRRLQFELEAMLSDISEEDFEAYNKQVFIHTLETEEDSFLTVSNELNQRKIAELIREIKPDVVVYDVFRDFGVGDLNTDRDMAETLPIIGRLTRKGNPQRLPMIIHHSLSSKSGMAKATGFDRGSYARNSKVLFGWVRAQINLAPYNPDDNEQMIVASGKCNNAKEFESFGISLDLKTMQYYVDASIDAEEWQRRISSGNTSKADSKNKELAKLARKVFVNTNPIGLRYGQIVNSIRKIKRCADSTARKYFTDIRDAKLITLKGVYYTLRANSVRNA